MSKILDKCPVLWTSCEQRHEKLAENVPRLGLGACPRIAPVSSPSFPRTAMTCGSQRMMKVTRTSASSFSHASGGNPENSLDTRLRGYDAKDFHANGHDLSATTKDEM